MPTHPATILLGYSIGSDLHALQFVRHAASMLLYPFTTCNTNISIEDRNATRALNSSLLYPITGYGTKEDPRMWVGLGRERCAHLHYFVQLELNEQFFFLRTCTGSALRTTAHEPIPGRVMRSHLCKLGRVAYAHASRFNHLNLACTSATMRATTFA